MSKYIPGNQKHLTLNDRIYIENELAKGTPFKDIAAFLCKDPTTISKEVRTHRLSDWYHKGTFYNAKNFCIHRYHCKKTNACGKILLCGIKCASFIVVCFILWFSNQNSTNNIKYTFLFKDSNFFFKLLWYRLFFTGFYKKNLLFPLLYIRK